MPNAAMISDDARILINPSLANIIYYRKSGLSLNHIIGCSLDCAYCVRHFYGNFEMKAPQLLCTNELAVQTLINNRFFIRDVTPIQIFNRATDPFLPTVKGHTHDVLRRLDNIGLKNPILLITRAQVSQEDVEQLEKLKHLKISLLVTYSGITDIRIEPIAKTNITVRSIETISKYKNKTKLIIYWRPIVVGWNDDDDSFQRVLSIADKADAVVYTGYYHRAENYQHILKLGLNVTYGECERRKFLPKELETRILAAYNKSGCTVPIFRKTSCGVTYVHQLPDYNGHWGVNEVCDICPEAQRSLCKNAYATPDAESFKNLLGEYDYETPFLIEDGHIWTAGLGEEKRYHLQHTLGYQVWDIDKPHFRNQHGRSPFGQEEDKHDSEWYENIRAEFYNDIKENDD